MAIYSWFSHLKKVIFHSYVSLPEGSMSVVIQPNKPINSEGFCQKTLLDGAPQLWLVVEPYPSIGKIGMIVTYGKIM